MDRMRCICSNLAVMLLPAWDNCTKLRLDQVTSGNEYSPPEVIYFGLAAGGDSLQDYAHCLRQRVFTAGDGLLRSRCRS